MVFRLIEEPRQAAEIMMCRPPLRASVLLSITNISLHISNKLGEQEREVETYKEDAEHDPFQHLQKFSF